MEAHLPLGSRRTRAPRFLEAIRGAALVAAAMVLLAEILVHGHRLSPPAWMLGVVEAVYLAALLLYLAQVASGVILARDRRGFLRQSLFDIAILALLALQGGVLSLRASVAVVVARQAVAIWGVLSGMERFGRLLQALQRRPTRVLAMSFLALIAIGTALLSLPAATRDGLGASWIDACFTAVSAACVTGLVVVDTGTYWSSFGQAVILALIQLGGLGIMTLATAVSLALGRTLGIQQRAVMQEITDERTPAGMMALVRMVVVVTLLLEGIGATLLFAGWRGRFGSPEEAVVQSVFHAVSAFCNAGFSLFPDSLARFQGDPAVQAVIMVLIILGGLGFPVLYRVFRHARRWMAAPEGLAGWELHDRLALVVTAVLLVAGALFFFHLEYEGALADLPLLQRLWAAAFQSVTARTAGFNTVDIAGLSDVTLLLLMALMFIGGSPASTAGGIKTTTVGVMVLSVRAMIRGREEIEILGRTIPKAVVYRATAVTFISVAMLGGLMGLLLALEPLGLRDLMFEAVSAFGTVGLTTGVTPRLGTAGKLVLILLMYGGRIGPLTLAVAVGAGPRASAVRYPAGRVLVG